MKSADTGRQLLRLFVRGLFWHWCLFSSLQVKMKAVQVISLTLLSVLTASAQLIKFGKCPKPDVQANFDVTRVNIKSLLPFLWTNCGGIWKNLHFLCSTSVSGMRSRSCRQPSRKVSVVQPHTPRRALASSASWTKSCCEFLPKFTSQSYSFAASPQNCSHRFTAVTKLFFLEEKWPHSDSVATETITSSAWSTRPVIIQILNDIFQNEGCIELSLNFIAMTGAFFPSLALQKWRTPLSLQSWRSPSTKVTLSVSKLF